MDDQSAQHKLGDALTHTLNTHGFSFQYAVLKEAKSCFEAMKSPWAFEVSEFPVAVKKMPTHIDFILKNVKEPFYIIAECKRANPALSNWCFVKTPYVSRTISTGERVVRETITVKFDNKNIPPRISPDWIERSKNVYRLAFEVKSKDKGDSKKGRGQINDATTQVLRGSNGLIELFVNHYMKTNCLPLGRYQDKWSRVSFIPVIFTTANLWVSDVDLSSADLETGNLDTSSTILEQKDWIFYNYSQSPNIKHGFVSLNENAGLSNMLYWDYTRTIPIVSSSGIRAFLSDSFWKYPEDWNREKSKRG